MRIFASATGSTSTIQLFFANAFGSNRITRGLQATQETFQPDAAGVVPFIHARVLEHPAKDQADLITQNVPGVALSKGRVLLRNLHCPSCMGRRQLIRFQVSAQLFRPGAARLSGKQELLGARQLVH